MSLHHGDTYNKVCNIIASILEIKADTISESSNLESLGADSLDRVEIIMKLEEEFGIEIKDEDAEKLATVADAVSYIESLQKK